VSLSVTYFTREITSAKIKLSYSTVIYLKTVFSSRNIIKEKCWDANSACYIHKYCMNEKGRIYCVHAPCFEHAKRKSSGYSTKIREK
jgi:hypothetical protein